MAVAFDEMTEADGRVRPVYAGLENWLRGLPPEVLEHRRREAEFLFRRIGITFAVYGESDSTERLIPFDVLPRILSSDEWTRLRLGLEQRVQGDQSLHQGRLWPPRDRCRAGIIPEDLVFQNPVFRPEMNGLKVPHDIYVHVAGIDIVRVDADTFYVLEDNARTPSGVSYMLENREIMMRLFPELLSRHRVAPVENYPDELLATLEVGGAQRPSRPTRPWCCSTPGIYNSAYYEHSFLADKLGIELVEGRDVVVKGQIAYMRTTEGLKRIDVIYRRIDDDFLDPLSFRPDSALGVPGLMAVYQAGNVTLANAVGTGIADDKAVYSYMPEIVKFYLGEEPILKNVPTWRCREPEHLSYVLDNLEELVVKEVHGSGGYGMLIGPKADQGDDRGVPRQAQVRPEELHRAADAGALDLPDLRRGGRRAAPCRPAAVRADRARPHPHRARRTDAGRAQARARWWSIRARAAVPRTPGCWIHERSSERRRPPREYVAAGRGALDALPHRR